MYILICGRGVPTKEYPTNGIFEFDQAKALSTYSKYKVIYLSIDARSFRRKRKWGLEIEQYDSNLFIYNLNIPLGRIPQKAFNSVVAYLAEKVFLKIKFDHGMPVLAHTHFFDCAYNYLFLKRKYNIPLVHTEHSSLMDKKDIAPKKFEIGLQVYNVIDELIVVSNSLGENLKKKYNVTFKTVGNLFNQAIFYYDEALKEDSYEIVSVGNLIGSKNMEKLIDVFNLVTDNFPQFKLRVFGDGEKRSILESKIKELNLSKQVILEGRVEREVIKEAFNRASFFILLSEHETFGVAYLEALASGLPVITTNCGGPEMFVDNSNGVIVNLESNINQIKDSFEIMLLNYREYNSKDIADNILDLYGEKAIVSKLEGIYINIIK